MTLITDNNLISAQFWLPPWCGFYNKIHSKFQLKLLPINGAIFGSFNMWATVWLSVGECVGSVVGGVDGADNT